MKQERYTLEQLREMGEVVTRAHGEIAVIMAKTARESRAFVRCEDGRYKPFDVQK